VPAARSVVIRKIFDVPRERLFAAWCRPELMTQWFFPAPDWTAEIAAEVKVDGRYRIAMRDPAGGLHLQEGAYRVIEPVSRLVFTWTCLELGVAESVVTLDLHDLGPRTELVLEHKLPDDEKIIREHEGGWHGCLASLARFIESERGRPPWTPSETS
jgi:uncharacterized protein YndB with AHSA1/START domain